MNFKKHKNLIFIIVIGIIVAVFGDFSLPKKPSIDDEYGKPALNYEKILNCKGTKFDNDLKVQSIISNLPANEFYTGSVSQKYDELSVIEIHLKDFNEVRVDLQDDKWVTELSEKIISKNASVLFALIDDVDTINFYMEDGSIYNYGKSQARDAYLIDNNKALDSILENDSALGRFYDIWLG